MPSFVATAGVTFIFAGASDSTSRTIPTADAVYFACTMWDGTGNTIAVTLAGSGPINSYQALCVTDASRAYFAVFGAVPSGSQTVAVSGGDAGDFWSCGFRGIDSIDLATPFDGQVSDTSTPAQTIDISTSTDGLAVGVVEGTDADLVTLDTEVFEAPINGDTKNCGVASSPGTGGTVQINWAGTLTNWVVAIGANLRHTTVAPEPDVIGRVNRASVPPNVRIAGA